MTNSTGVIIGRFQVHELHQAHIELIDYVLSKHQKVILFLGVAAANGTRRNPMDFPTRKAMMVEKYPGKFSAILPIHDNRSDIEWSKEIDKRIKEIAIGSAILYGSRDSFIPHYKGQFKVQELETKTFTSGTEVRKNISQQVIGSSEFRAGVIYSVYNNYPTVYSTVDVAILNNDGEILLGKKPNEDRYRFIGGFVDVKDENDFAACRREAFEETGAQVEPYEFVTSLKVKDWRYEKETDRKIMTRLYKARFISGPISPADDISELKWFKISDLKPTDLVFEHQPLYEELNTKGYN